MATPSPGGDNHFARAVSEAARREVAEARLRARPHSPSREVGAVLASITTDQFRGNVRCGRCGWSVGFLHGSNKRAPELIVEFLVARGWYWREEDQCLEPSRYLRWVARFPARAPYGKAREASKEAFIALPARLAPGASWRVGAPPPEPFFAKCPKCPSLRVKISLPALWAESNSPQAARKWNSARLVGKSNDGWRVGTDT